MIKNILFKTNEQKALSFLLLHPEKQFLEKEIREATGVSRSGINYAMRKLARAKLVEEEIRGRMKFYRTDLSNPFLRQFKILQTLITLFPLFEKIKKASRKIILFGSAASGTNTEESDFDIFILTNHPEIVFKFFHNSSLREKTQPIIKTPLQYVNLEKKEPAFFEQINRGIILWEGSDGSGI
ncbi:MAG: nucleotidyltransferase domain-containing protein [Firmicutes bacterium]|nr:nucleotidyltransferase domain-containing protein [Bacillota bacterium]